MKKFIYITVVLVALFLLFQNAQPYTEATESIVGWFRRYWSALTKGKAAQDGV